jgi:hypothetical protein
MDRTPRAEAAITAARDSIARINAAAKVRHLSQAEVRTLGRAQKVLAWNGLRH